LNRKIKPSIKEKREFFWDFLENEIRNPVLKGLITLLSRKPFTEPWKIKV